MFMQMCFFAESSFEVKHRIDLMKKSKQRENEIVVMTRFSLLEGEEKLCSLGGVVEFEILLRPKSRMSRVEVHITYTDTKESKYTRQFSMCCEMGGDTFLSRKKSSLKIRDLRIISIPPSKTIQSWSRLESETDSTSCAIILELQSESTEFVSLNEKKRVCLTPNRHESLFAIVPRCDHGSKRDVKKWFENHVRLRQRVGEEEEGDRIKQGLDISILSEDSLRHLYHAPVRMSLSVEGMKKKMKKDVFFVGSTIRLMSSIEILVDFDDVTSEIFLWKATNPLLDLMKMVCEGDVFVSGNKIKRFVSKEKNRHALLFTPLKLGSYYALTCVTIKKAGVRDRTVWSHDVLKIDVVVDGGGGDDDDDYDGDNIKNN